MIHLYQGKGTLLTMLQLGSIYHIFLQVQEGVITFSCTSICLNLLLKYVVEFKSLKCNKKLSFRKKWNTHTIGIFLLEIFETAKNCIYKSTKNIHI